MSANNKQEKRGKPIGVKDTVFVSIETLLKHAPQGVNTVVPVNRKWAEQFETFCNVKFIEQPKEVKLVLQETVFEKESLSSESASAIRARIIVEEEEL